MLYVMAISRPVFFIKVRNTHFISSAIRLHGINQYILYIFYMESFTRLP